MARRAQSSGSEMVPTERKVAWYERNRNTVKPLSEVLSDAISGVNAIAGTTNWAKSVEESTEIVSVVGGSVMLAFAELSPLFKVGVKLVEIFTKENDPHKIGYMACTLAYQQALVTALQGKTVRGTLTTEQITEIAAKLAELRALEAEATTFTGVSIRTLVAHPLVKRWDEQVTMLFAALGYDDGKRKQLILDIHQAFPGHLHTLLYNGKTREKFTLFTGILKSDDGKPYAGDVLMEYAQSQRWLYEEQPVLGTAPFSLHQIYLQTRCGELSWKDVKPRGVSRGGEELQPLRDPYKDGGHLPLTETVLTMLSDPEFEDAIVIQGPAGCGKSAFTQHLNYLLLQQGWCPVRILLRHLPVDMPIRAALSQALRFDDGFVTELKPRYKLGDATLFDSVLEEKRVDNEALCPYVLILDGWDEISVAGSATYQDRLNMLLSYLRQEFLSRRGQNRPMVRVIITGRPSTAYVGSSQFLQDDTPILTVRPLNPDDIGTLFRRVSSGLQTALPNTKPEEWKLPTEDKLKELQEGFKNNQQEVLESPLLALLTLRLMGKGVIQPDEALRNSTKLLRALVEETCPYGGNVLPNTTQAPGQIRLPGSRLRRLLQETAVAMTIHGSESIPHNELEARLEDLMGKEDFTNLDEEVKQTTGKGAVAALLISFFFKDGNRELGAEFHHKSFREYLFAESIVEQLLQYNQDQKGSLTLNDLLNSLALRLAPRWLTPEVKQHLTNLFPLLAGGKQANTAAIARWERSQEALIEFWKSWCMEQHLQPSRITNRRSSTLEPPQAVVWADWSVLQDTKEQITLPSLTALDAHLGEGLLLLNILTHSTFTPDTRFAPESGGIPMMRIIHRIATSEGRLIWAGRGDFPIQAYLMGADLRGAYLRGADLTDADLADAELSGADLGGADLTDADLTRAYLTDADLTRAYLTRAYLRGAYLTRADLTRVDLTDADLRGADLSGTDLRGADLNGADLRGADLTDADLRGAELTDADLRGAELTDADLRGARVWDSGRGSYVSLPEALHRKLSSVPISLPNELVQELITFAGKNDNAED